MNGTTRNQKTERLLLIALTLVGAVLRCWAFGALGLTHFDEGIYAISGLWSLAPGGLAALDPGVIPYAPGGFPVVVGLAYAFCGVSDGAAILAATVFGIALVPATGWVASRTFGPGAGAAAAALAAFSLAAIAFSRKALTDVPFLVFWLVAMVAAGRFLERPGFVRAVVLGTAVALAQYFKYNGWLGGAVTVIAAVAGAITNPAERTRAALSRTFGFGLLGAIVAACFYAPWYLFVERHGGYAALLRHHRSYLGSAGSWVPNFNAQLAQAHALSGAPGFAAIAWAVAWVSAWCVAGGKCTSARHACRCAVGLLAGAALLSVLTNLPWWIGLAALPWLLRAREPARRVLGAWWALLSVLTPLYHPYARLWLPLHAAGWILAAGLAAQLVARCANGFADHAPPGTGNRARRFGWAFASVTLLAAAAHAAVVRSAAMPVSWVLRPSPSLRDATVALAPVDLAGGSGPGYLVLARRPVAFYLTLMRQRVRLADGVPALRHAFPPDARALIDEAVLGRERDATQTLTSLEPYWTVEGQFAEELDPVTLLDVDPGAAARSHPNRRYFLWRLAPGATPPRAPTR